MVLETLSENKIYRPLRLASCSVQAIASTHCSASRSHAILPLAGHQSAEVSDSCKNTDQILRGVLLTKMSFPNTRKALFRAFLDSPFTFLSSTFLLI